MVTSELRTLFDRVATHFPGHTMQRLRLPDGRFRYTYASPGMRETFGLDPQAVLAEETASHDWIHEDDRARFVSALHRSADALETLDEEVRVRGADGHLRWVRSIGHPRRLDDDSVAWDGIALDVTARRETEAALERMLSLAREAEAGPSTLPAGRIGRALAEIGLHLDALERLSPPKALAHVQAVRAELSGLLGPEPSRPDDQLTPRQRDVLALMGEGCSDAQIAGRLNIRPGTAKLHVAAVLKRFAASNRTAAVAAARRTGLL